MTLFLTRNVSLKSTFFQTTFSKQRNTISFNRLGRNLDNEQSNNRLSWPQLYQRNRHSPNSSKNSEDDRRRKDSLTGSPNSSVGLERLAPDEARAIQRANQIVMYVKFFSIWWWVVKKWCWQGFGWCNWFIGKVNMGNFKKTKQFFCKISKIIFQSQLVARMIFKMYGPDILYQVFSLSNLKFM